LTMDSMRNKQPMTEPMAEPIMPSLRTLMLMWARKASWTSLLLSRLIANFRPWATREEKRKKLKETTSKTSSFLTMSTPALQAVLFPRLFWLGVVRESPTKTAMEKSEFTLTRPSRAVTCTLVVVVAEVDADVTLSKLSSFGYGDSDLARKKEKEFKKKIIELSVKSTKPRLRF
jgi:hypothetical protein